MESDPVKLWIEGLQKEDPRASEEIWQEYFSRLVRLAQVKMRGVPGRSYDEEDVAISAMNSFIQGAKANRFPNLNDHTDLWRLLVTITARKAQKHQRRKYAAKRGGGNVRGESVFINPRDPNEGAGIAGVMGSTPTPELAAEFAESTQLLMQLLTDQVSQEVVRLKMEGYGNTEIADQLGCTTRTIERKLKKIREKWVTHEA